MTNLVHFLSVKDAEEAIKYAIASDVFDLDQGFYGVLFPDRKIALSNIVKMLDECGSDLGCGVVAYNNDIPVGFLSYFPVEQKITRNLAGLKSCLDLSSSDNRRKLKLVSAFQHQLAPIESSGCYLNKIIVFSGSQGLSFGFQLFQYFLQEAKTLKLPAVFHVKRDNYKAINFYQRQGFEVENSEYEYVLCKQR